MLDKFSNIIVKRPWLVVGIILMITIGFGLLLPSLEMKTSMEDFAPDNDIFHAEQRISKYFGKNQEIFMIYVEKQEAENAVTPEALKEEYLVLKELDKVDQVEGSVSVAGFIDMVCQMEFGRSLLNCSDDEINTAFQDLISEHNNDEVKMMDKDDPNEKTDYNPHPRISKGKTIDSMDVKNYYISENDSEIYFSIEVYSLSHFESQLIPPYKIMNVIEWYIDFNNLIVPNKQLNIEYKIAAHIEPTNPIWEVGKGSIQNLKDIIHDIKNHELFKSFKKDVYLWIKPPDQDFFFPIKLKTGNVTFNSVGNRVEIKVEKEELEKFGIAPEMGSIALPARLGNSKAGTRFYQVPGLKLPWSRVTLNTGFIQKFIEKIQNRPMLNAISTKMLNKSGNFSWENFDMIFNMLNKTEALSLKDLDSWWIDIDKAPDIGSADNTFFIKPFFMEELKTSVITFLSDDHTKNPGPSATLMMVMINGSVNSVEQASINKNLVQIMEEHDNDKNYVKMSATGNGVISYQINEMTGKSNEIIMPGIFIAIGVILLLAFRKPSYMILSLVGLSISIIWIFGTMVLLRMPFNTMEVALVPLLMGLGVDYSVHMFHNYRAELEKGKSCKDAIVTSIRDVGMAMILATITTAISFLSFLTASVPPIRNFGILCAIGITYTFIVAITLQAAVRYILDRKKKNIIVKHSFKRFSLKRSMEKTSNIVCKHPRAILFVSLLITIVMISGAVNIQTEFNMEDFLPKNNPAIEIMQDVSANFPFSSQDQEYILIEGNVDSVDTLRGISKTYENLRDDKFIAETPNGDPKVTSILSIIQEAVRKNSTIASTFNIDKNGLPRNNQDAKQLYDYLYNSDTYGLDTKTVLHQDGDSYNATLIRVYTDISSYGNNGGDTNKNTKTLYSNLKADIANYGDAKAIATGEMILIYTITSSLTSSQVISTAVSMILAAMVLIIAYRKPLLGLIIMMPVTISIIWIIGTMYFAGYSLNVMTVMVTSLTIGLGITYAIHATERFKLTADRTGDVMKAVSETVGHTGGSLLIAAITTITGFGILILAPMPPEQQFGIITAMTIIYSFLTSIFILPPAVMFWGKWRKKRKGYVISPKKPRL